MSSEQRTVPLAQVLQTVHQEVATLAGMSDAFQETLSDLLGSVSLASIDLVAVQNLDLIAQHLGALATYVRNLAAQVPEGWAVAPAAAAADVNLAALAHRLSFHSADDIAAESDDPLLF
jgi:hypothetical protein